jgi:hypothetical protein
MANGLQSVTPIMELSVHQYNQLNLEIEAIDTQYASASAIAFMQAFYPPHLLSTAAGDVIDPDFVLANGSFEDYPMNGYQYPAIEVRSTYDPDSIWLNGYATCAFASVAQNSFYYSADTNSTLIDTHPIYEAVGRQFLTTRSHESDWSYDSAYPFYDTLDYLIRHNGSVESAFMTNGSDVSYYAIFAALAARQQWSLWGNGSVNGTTAGDQVLLTGGKTLAAKILALLEDNVMSQGTLQKFSLLVGDHENMIALLSLMQLSQTVSDQLYMLPPYASAMVFELFSYESPETAQPIPDPNNLFVRFLFRNASNPLSGDPATVNPDIQAYPIFNHGPSGTEMTWSAFQSAMASIAMNDVIDFCNVCQAPTLYCLPFLDPSSDAAPSVKHKTLSPVIAGVIGAVVTLAVIGLAALFVLCLAGRRLQFGKRRTSSVGGYKGSAKLASDTDLSIPNAAAMGVGAGASVEPKRGHERVGSWELKSPNRGSDVEQGDLSKHRRFESLASTAVGGHDDTGDTGEVEDMDDLEVLHSSPTTARESF